MSVYSVDVFCERCAEFHTKALQFELSDGPAVRSSITRPASSDEGRGP
jgi:hypothetical protein